MKQCGGNLMSYAQHAIDAVTDELEQADLGGQPYILRALYALLALARGSATTLEDVHDAWSIWRTRSTPVHPALIPFAELHPDVQEMDRPFVQAIHRAAVALAMGADDAS